MARSRPPSKRWFILCLILSGCVNPVSLPPPDQADLVWAESQWMKALGRETWGFLVFVQPGDEPEDIDGRTWGWIGKSAFVAYRLGYGQERRRRILLHELGHCLRVQHNPDPRSTMYCTGPTLTILPDDLEQARKFIDTPWPLGGLF